MRCCTKNCLRTSPSQLGLFPHPFDRPLLCFGIPTCSGARTRHGRTCPPSPSSTTVPHSVCGECYTGPESHHDRFGGSFGPSPWSLQPQRNPFPVSSRSPTQGLYLPFEGRVFRCVSTAVAGMFEASVLSNYNKNPNARLHKVKHFSFQYPARPQPLKPSGVLSRPLQYTRSHCIASVYCRERIPF